MPEAAMTAKDAVGGLAAPLDDSRTAVDGHATMGDASPPVILSKVRIPRQRPVTLGRGRLLGWLDQHATDRVVTVAAEVGYGKSTLLADHVRRSSMRCAWYRVEESDADWISFLGHMVAAIGVAVPGFGRSTEALLRHVAAVGPTRDIVTSSLLAEMSQLPAERTVVVLDDFHLVGDSDDVRSILRRFLDNAPDDWHFAIATRGRPTLPIGRVAAQGSVAELTTQELRFTRAEVGELFDLHLHELTAEALDIVYERTQGWAASLQLVLASIAASRPSEVESFIAGLSGAQGPIHDFLAQEVLARVDETTERVLVHASLLDRVTPTLVTAALSVTASPVDLPTSSRCLVEAEGLGLLVTADDENAGSRFHPLLRDFLRHQLERTAVDGQIPSMHVAIAVAAEDDDWLAAGSHYARGGQPDESMRVLGSAAFKALGTGAWGAATAVAASTPGVVPPPAVEVIRARGLIAEGRAAEALEVLAKLERDARSGSDLPILRLTRANGLHITGNYEELARQLASIARDESTPQLIQRIAACWLQMIEANRGGSIVSAYESLQLLARDTASERLYYYAGVALNNAAAALLAMGRTEEAKKRASEAIATLRNVDDAVDILPTAKMIVALAELESGRYEVALRLASDISLMADVTAGALAEGSYIATLVGRRELADDWLGRFTTVAIPGSIEAAAAFQAVQGRFTLALSRADWEGASSLVERVTELSTTEMDGYTRASLTKALLDAALGASHAAESAHRATALAEEQGARRWVSRSRILEAAALRDRERLGGYCEEATVAAPAALLETAHAIAGVVDLFEEPPGWLQDSVRMAPAHWLPILRQRLRSQSGPPALPAAILLTEFGTIEDATLLKDFEQHTTSSRRRRGLVAKLARRVSPTVRVHDLGLATCEIGGRLVELSEARRRAAALLLYLVTRPSQSAARDQVMEDLWPEQAAQSALNSLHQTTFFLRRLLEPWQDGLTSAYVRMEADVVLLNPELFQIDSVAFLRQATSAISARKSALEGPGLLRLYRGTFAPEFEYEPWAENWRTQVHSTFLRLADVASRELIQIGDIAGATDLLTHVTSVDSTALDLRGRLVQTMAMLGAKDAAAAQYRGLVAAYEREVGEPPPPFRDLVPGPPPM